MPRDSLFGETILWSGSPREVPTSSAMRLVMAVSGSLALVALSYAVVVATALHVSVGGLILFAAWASGAGLFAYRWPRFWWARVEYVITDRHVIWRRGPIRRSIDRDSISYALIRWNPNAAGVGDLILVRAVPIALVTPISGLLVQFPLVLLALPVLLWLGRGRQRADPPLT